jgi:hypothetical protein
MRKRAARYGHESICRLARKWMVKMNT